MKRALANYGWVVLLAFGVVYAGSQAFVYVEGDDAATVAYHALGREAALQPPYSSYHGMMDCLLGVFPASESVVRTAALGVSSLCAIGVVLLMMGLAFEWLPGLEWREKALISLVLLLAMPELFFFGLVYTPSVMAMCFIVGAHLLLRWAKADEASGDAGENRLWAAALSLALFGFGVSCRWDTAAYGLVIVVDVWVGLNRRELRRPTMKQLGFGFVWGTLALVASFGFIQLSGYGIAELAQWVEMSRQASSGYFDTGFGLFTFVGRHLTFFTPGLVFLVLVGLGSLLRSRQGLVVKALAGFLPLLPLLYRGAPKLLLPVVPGLAMCLAEGFRVVWMKWLKGPGQMAIRAGLLALLLGPWLVGLKVYSDDTQWGPGFEVRTAGSEEAGGGGAMAGDDRGRRIGVSRMVPAWGDGFAVATPEGPRSAGAFWAVLVGGGWRGLVRTLEGERVRVIEEAIRLRRPVLQDDGNSLIVVHLLGMGYATRDARKQFEAGISEREFTREGAAGVTVLQLQERPSLFEPAQVRELMTKVGSGEVVFYSNYSSSLTRLFEAAPDAGRSLGPFSAVVDLGRLREALEEREEARMTRAEW